MSQYKFTLPLPRSNVRADRSVERIKELLPVFSRKAEQDAEFTSQLLALQNQRDALLSCPNGTFEERVKKSKQLGHLTGQFEEMVRQVEAERLRKCEEFDLHNQTHAQSEVEFVELVAALESNLRSHCAELRTRTIEAIKNMLLPFSDGEREAIYAASSLYIIRIFDSLALPTSARDFTSKAKRALATWEQLSPYFQQQ